MILSKTSFFQQIAIFYKYVVFITTESPLLQHRIFSNFRLMIWDTAGQEEFDAITR